MRLNDSKLTIALVVFAAFYFGEWTYNKINPEPKQCWYEYKKSDSEIIGKWEDCKPKVPSA
jgi:hypothetical protein